MTVAWSCTNNQCGSTDCNDRYSAQNHTEDQPIILVVDDEEPMLKLLRANLSLEGYHVTTAANGKSALELVEEHKPALVILDIMMPGLNGFQVLDLIRRRNDVPVIMLTAKWELATENDALALGANDYVRKPFSIVELLVRIRAKLKRAGRQDSQVASAYSMK